MSLPILSHHPTPTTEDLVRFYHRCQLQWARQTAEEETLLDVGIAMTNRSLPDTPGNVMVDASLPPGMSAAAAVALADEHFAASKLRCRQWVLNPAVPADQTRPLGEHLIALGWRRQDLDIMHLTGRPASPIEEVSGFTIIPARASFRHARMLTQQFAPPDQPQIAELLMLNLEDPQTDALMALKDGTPAAYVAVLPVGDMGCIEDLFVAAPFRGQGVGRTMMSRALEICARSLFKHVFLSCERTNAAAVGLYQKVGFQRIGAYTSYHAAA